MRLNKAVEMKHRMITKEAIDLEMNGVDRIERMKRRKSIERKKKKDKHR